MTGVKTYGHDRVVFRAHLTLIRTELDAGHTMQAVFNRNRAKLGTMSYRQFVRYVGREITEPAVRTQPVRTPAPRPPLHPSPPATTKLPQGTHNARHEHNAPGAYIPHDGNPREDDLARLITGKRS